MKRLILFFFLCTVTKFAFAQKNLVNDGRFEQTSFSVNDISRKIPAKGIWYPHLTSDQQAVITVKKDEQKGNVVSMQTLSNVSYAYSYVGQEIAGALTPGVYTLSFYAKATTDVNTYLSTYLRLKAAPNVFSFFPINKFNPKEMVSSSGALKQFRLSKDWVKYSVEFDLSKTINNAASPSIAKTEVLLDEATDVQRKDFYLGLSCLTKNAGVVFTDVSLTKNL
jgi:hypothetical protein